MKKCDYDHEFDNAGNPLVEDPYRPAVVIVTVTDVDGVVLDRTMLCRECARERDQHFAAFDLAVGDLTRDLTADEETQNDQHDPAEEN